jgi:hypothetical protein
MPTVDAASEEHYQDVMEYRKSGKWQKQLFAFSICCLRRRLENWSD